ncbi:hypothetical protein HYC85_005458 [Camellia sinensis]|uniref:Uncharacterized protein n=1 Tax=Camellia sinensis TaxID=4442 RepID=A0A7J7HZJ9_CAMSI|nr:hypothetical protein HYC85_005458 [Camellia sinensis]
MESSWSISIGVLVFVLNLVTNASANCSHEAMLPSGSLLNQFTFEVAVLSIFGKLESGYKDKLKDNFFTLDRGYNCFPINLPGTAYRRALLSLLFYEYQDKLSKQTHEFLVEFLTSKPFPKKQQKSSHPLKN